GGVLRTTADHSVFVRTRDGIKAIPASELRPGDVLVGLPLKVRGEFVKGQATPHSTGSHAFDALQVSGMLAVYEGDEAHRELHAYALAQRGLQSQASIGAQIGASQMTVSNWPRGVHEPHSISSRLRPTKVPEHVAITPGLMKLFGYYTAEGRENGCLEFTFGTRETDLHADVTRLMKEIFDVEPKIRHTLDNSTKITYHVAALGRFFERHCGTGSREKHVPEILWDLSREHFEAFLTGYALGDGYVSKEGKLSMTSVSHQLMLELRWLCAMHGIPSGLRQVHLKAGRIIKRKPLPATTAWNLIIGKSSHGVVRGPANQGKRAIVRKIVEREFDGFVYDLCGCDNEAFFGGEKPVLLHNSRVRDLFEQGRKNAPCIIFIDEIDAVGRHRGAGLGGGHDEREQTLNQLLVEMDGFDSSDGVILIAATNRPDVLDPALLRPGRFDRQIVVDMPDVKGRLGILKVHARPIPLEEGVELEKIARGTPGFSGADLANVMNEAALLAARRNRDRVTMGDLLDAKDKVAMGAERRSLIINEKEKEVIAYHEAGHALVACMVPGADPIEKVTIVPRGRSLGATYQLPVDERHNLGRDYLLGKIAIIMGGRVAEEIVFHEITNGAKGDIDMATHLARRMVCEWGMSDRLGPIALGRPDEEIFLGREIVQNRHVSEETAEAIDAEVRSIIESAKERAHDILAARRAVLDSIAVGLLERETLDEHEVQLLANGSPLPVLDRPGLADAERATPVRPVEEAASG
ncbi:MAG TPA: AAA family ATPase, partial [bacterium]|nr:AAA family ATPase [bacterium]